MKYLYTLSVLLFVVSVSAQDHGGFPAYPADKHIGGDGNHAYKVNPASFEKSGSTYYSEDFDTGLGMWTVSTPVGQVDWKHTTTGPGPTPSTYPVPPLNSSTPAGWIIIDDDFDGVSGSATEAHLVSPVIDLSSAPVDLKLEFEQYFQEFQLEHCYVGISTDGGMSWNEVEINEGVGRDGRPNAELVDINISAWVAMDPSNVQIRFKYESTWDYGWQVDNVTIKDLPDNDMAILQSHYNNFDFDATGLANIEYSIYPSSQVPNLSMFSNVKNKGAFAQTNVEVQIDVTEPNNTFGYTTPAQDVNPGDTISPMITAYTPSGDLGLYVIDYEVTQDSIDGVPDDNTDSDEFWVQDDIFAQDRGTCIAPYSQGLNNIGDQYELGNYFEIVNDGDMLYSILVAVSDSSVVGTLVYGQIYDINDDPIETADDLEIQASDLNQIGDSLFVCIPLSSPLELFAGEVYLVMAGHYGGADDVWFCTAGTSPAQVSLIKYPNSNETFFVTRTPMVRMGLSACVVGIDEQAIAGIEIQEPRPNPFSNSTILEFELIKSSNISYRLTDISGKMVRYEDMGRFPQGISTLQVDRQNVEAGIYTLDVITETGSISKKLVITD